NLSLVLLDLLFHARERVERRLVGHRRHGFRNTLLRFGTTLPREQQCLLAVCFFDVVVQITKRILEAIGFLLVRLPCHLHLLAARDVLVPPHERLLGQLVAPFLDGKHRAPLPLLGLAQLAHRLVFEALLIGDRGSDLLLGSHELRPHVGDDLGQHLVRLLYSRDRGVHVCAKETRYAFKDAHADRIGRSSWSRWSSRTRPGKAEPVLSMLPIY